jgi:hypothetical protein
MNVEQVSLEAGAASNGDAVVSGETLDGNVLVIVDR